MEHICKLEQSNIGERVAVLENQSASLFKKLDEIVNQLREITTFYTKSLGFAKGVQWLSGGILLFVGWILGHLRF